MKKIAKSPKKYTKVTLTIKTEDYVDYQEIARAQGLSFAALVKWRLAQYRNDIGFARRN